MKRTIIILAAALSTLSQAAVANPITTLTRAPTGTTFVVTVDWEANTVIAKLQSNPARLTGPKLEQAMQLAAYYGSAVGCGIAPKGRVVTGAVVSGRLDCPWFD